LVGRPEAGSPISANTASPSQQLDLSREQRLIEKIALFEGRLEAL
jgi:hypothetical protein